MGKKRKYKKIVEWGEGDNLFYFIGYIVFVIFAMLIMQEIVFWKQAVLFTCLFIAFKLLDMVRFPKRKVY